MRSHVLASEQDFARLSSAEEIRRRCREALTGQSGTSSTSSSADQELACVQFLTSRCLGSSSGASSSTSVSLYSIFVQTDGAEPTLLHLLAQRLGNTSPDMRTRILSCLNAFHMPEYLLPAFLASLENAQWQVRLQAILALQSLQRFTQQQKQILEGALTKILESDSSDLVKQASKQTLALWEEFAGYEDSSSAGVAGAAAGGVGGNGTAGGATSLGTTMGGAAVGVGGGLSMPSGMIPGGFIGATSDAGGQLQHLQPHAMLGMSASLEGEQQHQHQHQHQHKQQGVNTSLSSTHLDTSFDSSNDSLRSAFQNSTNLMNKYLVPENFADRLARGDTTEVMQLLEDTHQVILGGTPIGFDPHTCQCVSLLDVTVLKRVVEAILGIAHFKVSLTTLYIIGDLVAHESIQMLRVLPRVLHRILEKLADAKFVIRQTTCKLLTKIIGAMLSDPGSDLTQMAHLLFEEFEASTTNSAKCESLITVMTTLVTLHPKLAEIANPRFSKWFDKAKDERACILLGEGLAVCARVMPPGESRSGYGLDRPENYSHTSATHLNILKAQVSLGRENVRLPAVNDESLLEYAQSIQASLDGNTFSAQIQHGYDIFGGRKMPAPILKSSSSRCEDDKMSAVSSRARSRVTFSEPGDEKPTKSSASSTCGGSSSGASSSSGDSRPFVQFNSPKKSLADEVHNFLSSDLDLLSSTSDGHLHTTSSARLRPPPQVGVNHFAPGAPHAAHVGFHGSATTKMSSSSTSRGGGGGGAAVAPHHQHHFGHHTGGFQNFGGGHLPAGFSGAGGASSSTFVQDPFSYHDPLSMNVSFGASTATAGAHGHHHSGTITMGMGSAAGAGGIGAVGTSTTNMLQLHIPGGGGHHGLPPSSMDQHSTNHEHNQSIRDRLRLLKARVRTDQRGLLRSEGSMQPSATASMHNLDQRSVMSAGEPIPWGLGVISLSKVDNFQIGGHLGRESLGLDRNMVRESFGGSKGNKQMARSRSDTTSTGLRGNPRRFQF